MGHLANESGASCCANLSHWLINRHDSLKLKFHKEVIVSFRRKKRGKTKEKFLCTKKVKIDPEMKKCSRHKVHQEKYIKIAMREKYIKIALRECPLIIFVACIHTLLQESAKM